MIEILKAVIAELIAAGHDIDCVYGERWVQGFKSDKVAKVTFFVNPQEYSYDTNTAEKSVNLKWVVAKEIPQNEINEDTNSTQELSIEAINLHFIQSLKQYEDANGRQLINDFGTVRCSAFHDLTLFSMPASGFTCEATFKQIMITAC